jgi:2,4-dienoyl-CoA reductase-like NADH-dependent reductase (Old Yellow Enzyme family)
VSSLGDPLRLTETLTLRNRLVATAHGSGAVTDGVPQAGDAEYWERVAAGGVGMVIGGGAVVAPASTIRRGNFIALWRPEVIEPLRRRAAAIRSAGAVSIMQLLHLGRETLGAETYYSPIAPSAVRSSREPTAPRALADDEIDDLLAQFRTAASNALAAGIDGFELHAAHGYLFAQFLSATVNRRPEAATLAGRVEPIWRVVDAIRELDPACPIGIRLSVGDREDAGLDHEALGELLGGLHPAIGYVNLTVGMRTNYVRDMATERPPLLDDLPRLRAATSLPLLVSQAFRDRQGIEAALDHGADLVGLTRPLIADPDLPRKLAERRDHAIRPCVACNEDCRAFDPVLLCSVNPALGPPGETWRPAAPVTRGAALTRAPRRVAVIGAGPAGLECALGLTDADNPPEVTLYDRGVDLGGALAIAATAPHRHGWRRLLDFYRAGLAEGGAELRLGDEPDAGSLADFDAIVVATGSHEAVPPSLSGAPLVRTATEALAAGPEALAGIGHLVVVDDGFGWWPGVSAVELGVAAAVHAITVLTPGTAFAGGIPPEARVQLMPRLAGVRLEIRPFAAAAATGDGGLEVTHTLTGGIERLAADAIVAVGERRPCAPSTSLPEAAPVVVVGDAIVPRRVAHAVAEGRAAARRLIGAEDRSLAAASGAA